MEITKLKPFVLSACYVRKKGEKIKIVYFGNHQEFCISRILSFKLSVNNKDKSKTID